MDDLSAAKTGHLDDACSLNNPKALKYHRDLAKLLVDMRKKRDKTQQDFNIPQRTIRRLEKGDVPHCNVEEYICEMKPCHKEMAHWIRILSEATEPKCKKCDPDCQMYGKTSIQFINALRKTVGLKER